jgi:TPR repeat protein
LASNLDFVKGVKKRKMIMNYIQKVLTVFFVIGFISICVAHQSIAESNFQEIISKAEQGEADAQYHLGSMYYSGEGVPHDDEQAIQWYTKAAEQGHVDAQYNLALMYKNGEGVLQDYMIAYAWFNLAAFQGGELPKKNRDIILERMTPSQIEEGQKHSKELYDKIYNRDK